MSAASSKTESRYGPLVKDPRSAAVSAPSSAIDGGLDEYFSHRSHFETLQYKQRVKKDLEEDLHLLSDGLNEAEGHRERTMAELELQ